VVPHLGAAKGPPKSALGPSDLGQQDVVCLAVRGGSRILASTETPGPSARFGNSPLVTIAGQPAITVLLDSRVTSALAECYSNRPI
jgi:hypothetical protein